MNNVIEELLRAARDDIELIRKTAGDLQLGYVGNTTRGNIGGPVSRACGRLAALIAAVEAQQNTGTELPVVDQNELKALGVGCRRKAERRVNPNSDPRTMMTGCRRESDRRKG